MGQDISLKSERKNPWFKPWFNIFCTHNCVCHSIRSMFRVLGIYNFGAAKACQPAHLAAHQLPPFCITITTGQAEAIWQSRKKDYECPYFNPSPLRDCWLKCLVFLVLLHTVWTLKAEDISVCNWKKKFKNLTLVFHSINLWYFH